MRSGSLINNVHTSTLLKIPSNLTQNLEKKEKKPYIKKYFSKKMLSSLRYAKKTITFMKKTGI